MNASRHFEINDWADFVRGAVDAAREREMRLHLETGCRRCAELCDAVRRISQLAKRDAEYEPPEAIVRIARALFDRRKSEDVLSIVSSLLFDSQRVAAPQGLRTGASRSRRLVVANDGLVVDLQVPAPEEPGAVLIGQIKAQAPERCVQGLHLRLHNRRMRVVARADTNRLGEFQMEFESATDPLALVIWSDDDAKVIQVIPLGAV
jgi:hypothetical protein